MHSSSVKKLLKANTVLLSHVATSEPLGPTMQASLADILKALEKYHTSGEPKITRETLQEVAANARGSSDADDHEKDL